MSTNSKLTPSKGITHKNFITTGINQPIQAIRDEHNNFKDDFYNFKDNFNKYFDLSNLLIYSKNDLSYGAIIEFDNSGEIILNLKQINQFIDSKNFSTGGGNNGIVGTASGGFEYVNDVSQTFYEIMTQQPYKFDGSGIPMEITSSIITLSWNYDNIIAKHNIEGYNAKLAFLDNNKQKQLPYINNLVLEISGNVDGYPTGWIDLSTVNIPDSVFYNQETYKVFELSKYTSSIGNPGSIDYSKNSIISSLDIFDLRIYGSNFSEQVPSIDNRSLYFYNIAFPPAQPPSQPNFINEIINSNSQFTITYDVSFTENDVSDSDAVLNGYKIDYSQNETKASIIYPVVITDLSNSDSLSNIEKEQNFDVSANELRSGTTYNYSLAVKNNLNDFSYSEYSNSSISSYTQIPSSNEIGTTLHLGIGSTYTNVSTESLQGLNDSPVLYINLSDSQSISPGNSLNQSIEITNPYSSNQQTTTSGYGKYIDNSLNLVQLTVSINDISKQKITFDGSFSSNNGKEEKLNDNSFNYISLASGTSLQDIWDGNDNNKGFRLKGLLKLNQIAHSSIQDVIGDPSLNPYLLTYDYERNVDVGGTNQSVSHNIYVDDLSLDPVGTGNNTSNVVNVLYNFGIPSVKQFDLSFSRTYTNINSQFMYLPGNKIIANVEPISYTSATSTKNITLSTTDISSSGIYNFNDSEFDSKTSNYYNSLNYTSSRFTAGNNLTWTEDVYSLLKSNGITHSLTHITNHYLDYASFSKSGSMISAANINLTTIHIYEISNISLLGSNLGGLELEHYNDHTKQIKEYTLLYINNNFQSNASQTYPAIGDFSYNGVTIINDFSAGLISYDLNGSKTSNNSGYKYIAFKLYKSGNSAYTFNNSTHNLHTNADNVKYLKLKTILTQSFMFDENDVNNIFDDSITSAIGFARVTRATDSVVLIGNLKQLFDPVGGNWNINGSPASISYNDSLQLKYGAKVIDGANNYGLYVSPTAINDDLTIFIGIKNI